MTRALAMSLAALLLTSATALSQNLTTVESRFAVKETSDRLAAELEKRGIRIAARIDHAAAAKAVGLDMPPTEVIMFGNPRLAALRCPSSSTDAGRRAEISAVRIQGEARGTPLLHRSRLLPTSMQERVLWCGPRGFADGGKGRRGGGEGRFTRVPASAARRRRCRWRTGRR